jgi:nitrite reductase (NADH) small subunit
MSAAMHGAMKMALDDADAAAPVAVDASRTPVTDAAGRNWIDVCAVDDVPVQGARVLKRPGRDDVALFRTASGAVFALRDRCPHKGGPLSQGIVFGERVSCPLHAWSIGLADGAAAAPDAGCTRAFAVRLEGGRVRMDADELLERD